MMTSGERRLVARICGGEAAALSELYDLFGSAVYEVALRLTADEEAAEGITESLFTSVWRDARAVLPHPDGTVGLRARLLARCGQLAVRWGR
jgi:RNA polymerase sigma-70 factor (ECF subfamily)